MNRRRCGRVAGVVAGCVVAGWCVLLARGQAADVDRAAVAPGLRAEFEAVQTGERDMRLQRVLGLAVAAGEPATPFLPAGPFVATWRGYIEIDLRDRFVFEFEGRGELELRIGGELVLAGGGDEAGVWRGDAVRLSGGLWPIEAVYRGPVAGESAARVFWSSSRFAREAIPPGVLFHDADDAELRDAQRLRAGRQRLATGYCIRCHMPGEGDLASLAMPELGLDAPPLVGIADKLRPQWMARWVEDPRALHPEARMPRMFHGEDAARDAADVAAYLATLTLPRERGRPRPHEAPEADERTLREGARLYASLGCVSCHTLDAQPGAAGPHAPGAAGPRDEPERLPLWHVGEKWQPGALRDYLLNPQGYYGWSRMPDFGLSDAEAEALAAFLLDRAERAGGDAEPIDLEGADAQRGMRLVAGSGCVNCHAAAVPSELIAPSLGAMAEALRGPGWDTGCMAHDAAGRGDAPHVHLDDEDRAALRAFADAGFDSLSRADLAEFAERQIESLRCTACHDRDGRGDLWTEYEHEVAAWLSGTEREAEGEPPVDQSRPSLTHAGEMLQPDWVADLLAGRLDYKVRPWLDARMPAFGPVRAGPLAEGLARSHGVSPDEDDEHEPDEDLAAVGARLVSGVLGFACTDCHAVGDRPAENVFEAEGVNFMYTAERLRPDYYHRWMMDPQRITPGSRMPRYAEPDGTTVLVDVFGGDAAAQFEAIRHYLLAGRQISPPEAPDVVAGAPDRTLPVELGGEFREEDYDDDRWERMEIGRLFSGSIRHPEAPGVADGVTYKGLAIQVGDEGEAAVMFDTDLLRISVGWRGGFIRTDPTRYGLLNLPAIGGEPVFATRARPGWADTAGRFDDPRERPYGPLPAEWGRYDGLYKHGDRIVLSYRVGEAAVLDSPWVESAGGATAFARTLEVGPAGTAMSMTAAESNGAAGRVKEVQGAELAVLEREDGRVVAVGLVGDERPALAAVDGSVRVSIPARADVAKFKLLIWAGEADDLPRFAALLSRSAEPEALERLTEPGPTRWGEPLVTRGQLGRQDGPWAVDTLTVPYENPYHALMFTSGHDLLPNGDIAVSTAHGDVWIVGGIDDTLEELTWTRFATGLFQPLGVRVLDGRIHVLGRDQITILHDRNGNGEADYYENFSNLVEVDASGHAYVASLHTDAEGNFYFTRGSGGGRTAHEGALLRISADGGSIDVVATGFRYPNGMSVGPDGTITVADQDGEWVPSTRIDRIEPGGFYGFMPSHHRPSPPEDFDGPMAWVPHGVDNSAGGQVWVAGDRWGLAEGSLVHLSFGRCTAFLVLHEQVQGVAQGGVVRLPVRFLSGAMRGRFSPHDGQLYLTGMRGWQTSAIRDGGLQRMRYTGEPMRMPIGMSIHADGIRLTFSEPLDRAVAQDPRNYAVERWNYRWTAQYGSDDWSVEDPDRRGRDAVAVVSATLGDDGRELFLQIADMKPVMQMGVRYNIDAADGSLVSGAVYPTVHRLGEAYLE